MSYSRDVRKDISLIRYSKEWIRDAGFVEEKGLNDYLYSLKKVKTSSAASTIASILVETLLHHEMVKAILRAYERIESIGLDALLRSKQEEAQEDIEFIKNAITNHLIIEKDMSRLYEHLAKDENLHPLVREIFGILAKNEVEHHKQLSELLSSIQKKG